MRKIINEGSNQPATRQIKPTDRWCNLSQARVTNPRYSACDLRLPNQSAKKILSFAILKWVILIVLVAYGNVAYADFASGDAAFKNGDYQKAYEVWLPSANSGDASSQTGIGVLFQYGLGVPKDDIKAIKWYELAVEQGNGAAQLMLAVLYRSQKRYADAELLYERSLAMTEKSLGLDHPDVAQILNELGILYQEQGRYVGAGSFFERTLDIREKALGPNHSDVSDSLYNLGMSYKAQGRFAEADPLYQRALGIKEEILGPDHPIVAQILNELGISYQQQGRYVEAGSFFERALDIREKAFGPNHSDVSDSLNNLGMSYQSQGRYADAEPLYKRALGVKEKILGPDHPDVASILDNLGMLFQAQGNYAEAEPLLEKSLNVRKKAFGAEHLDVAKSQNNLALLYQDQGRFEEAETFYKLSVETNEKILGTDHPEVAKGLNNLGMLYQSQGRYSDAESLFKRSISINELVLSPEHPELAKGLNNLGLSYQSQGRYADAEPLFKQALRINKLAFGTDHPDVATILMNLAVSYHYQGNYMDAEQVYKQALGIKEKILAPDHPGVATILLNLGLLYQIQGNYAEAKLILKQALSIQEKALGKNHPTVAATLTILGSLYSAQGRYFDAETPLRRSLFIRETVFGPDHTSVATSLNNLGLSYQSQGRYADAEPLFKRSIAINELALGKDHPELAKGLNNLAMSYQSQGRYADAETLFKRSIAINELALGKDHPELAKGLNNLAMSYQSQGRYADAESLFERSIAMIELAFGKEHPDVATSLLNLANVQKNQGRYTEAESIFKQSISIREKALGKDHPWAASSLYQLARMYWSIEKPKESLDLLQRAIGNIRTRPLNFGNLALVPSNEQELFAELYSEHVKVALEMQGTDNNTALISEAFESIQLANISEAGSALKNTIARFAANDDEIANLVRQRQNAAKQQKLLDQKLIKSFSEPPGEPKKNASAILSQSIEENKKQLKELDYKIERTFPKFAEFSSNEPDKLDDVQMLLAHHEALFTFLIHDSSIYAFFVRKNDVRTHKLDLGEEQLTRMVTSLRDNIDLSAAQNIADIPKFDLDLAHKLYVSLLGPFEDMLNSVKHLLVVPSGPMESLPFNILVTEPPAAKGADFSRYQSAAWLPKRFAITRLPSVSSLRALRTFATKTQANGSFKGFGDPVLNGQPGEIRGLKIVDLYQGTQASTDKLRDLPELPDTTDELRLIAKYLNASEDDLYLRERASETELKSADLSNSRVLGFATHGLVAGELSGLAEPALVLTPPAIGSDIDDGLLTASEVAQLSLNADIVLLSACNTASGSQLGAEGLSGLARAFIYAGTRSLLVSHWSVDSGAAVKLTTGLFGALEANLEMGRAEALQYSMMSLVSDDENPHYSHPAFWAPFSLIGEGAAIE